MSKPEWGTKRVCQKCFNKFYDLKKSPIICPSCGTEYVLAGQEAEKKAPKSKVVEEDVLEDDFDPSSETLLEEDLEDDNEDLKV